MKLLNILCYKIKEKRPSDGQECWVLKPNSYPKMQCYNESYNVWDDASGDDYEYSVDDDDIWMALPTANLLKE